MSVKIVIKIIEKGNTDTLSFSGNDAFWKVLKFLDEKYNIHKFSEGGKYYVK